MSAKVLSVEAAKKANLDLIENGIGTQAVHDVVVAMRAARRSGSANTKTKAEVNLSGAKPWRQKGTGRARQGSTRSPQWIHGGIALGPKPRDYRITLNKKLKRVALKSALSSKVLDNDLIVVDSIASEEYKTKNMVGMLKNLNVDQKALIVLADVDSKVVKSTNNIQGVQTTFVGTLNVYDILAHDKFIITKEAIAKIEEVCAQ